MRIVLIFTFLYLSLCGMEGSEQKGLIIPSFIAEHSDLLKMLVNQGQADFQQYPLKLLDGSLVTQDHLDAFAQIYQPDIDYGQLSLEELVSLSHYEDFFRIDSPSVSLQNVLYDKLEKHEIGWENIRTLSPDKQYVLGRLLVKKERLDIRLLKPYSDDQITRAQPVDNNIRQCSVEKLLFFNNDIKVYRGYDLPRFSIIKEFPRLAQLLVKKDGYVQKEVNLRLVRDGYLLINTTMHPSGLYALTDYINEVHDSYVGDHSYVGDYIDLTKDTAETISNITHVINQQKSSGASCFGNNYVYSAACDGGTDIIIRSIHLQTKTEVVLGTLQGVPQQEVVGMVGNNADTELIVATRKQLFFITISPNNSIATKVKDAPNSEGVERSIKKISLNNSGTVLCVVMQRYLSYKWYDYDSDAKVYLYHIKKQDCPIEEISDKLQGNHDLKSYEYCVNKSCLSDISKLFWSTDDFLLILKCSYRYQDIDDGRMGSAHFAGNQHAFVNLSTGNGWSENNRYKYPKSVVTSCNGNQAIITDRSGWLLNHTTLLSWYDEKMEEVVRYLNLRCKDNYFSLDKKFLGIVLLDKILKNHDVVMQLDKEETEIYQNNMPDALKVLLAKTRTVLLHKDNLSSFDRLWVSMYKFGIYCKHLLYGCSQYVDRFSVRSKKFFKTSGAILCVLGAAMCIAYRYYVLIHRYPGLDSLGIPHTVFSLPASALVAITQGAVAKVH